MKNLLYIISLCGLLTACDLQEEPYGFYSDDNFYKSETDAESGLLYAYNALTFLEYSRGIFYIGDIPTETMSPKSDEAGDVYQLENWIANRETEQLQYYFKYCYIAINRANTVIDHIQNSSVLSETARRRIPISNSRRSLFPACMELFQSGAYVRHRARADKDGGGAIADNASDGNGPRPAL